MKKDPKIFLEHILESIRWIEIYTESFSQEKFLKNVQLQDCVTRRLEIIGEAVKNIPGTLKDQHPNIPWKKIAGIRDIVIHEYFGVDNILIWKIVKQDIPKLKENILKLLS